jgi:MraZ protein
MALFLATHENKLDKKGRVSLPASFRQQLGSHSSIVLIPSWQNQCLEGYSFEQFQDLSRRTDLSQTLTGQNDEFAYQVFARAQEFYVDSEGRFVLSQIFRNHAELTHDLIFVGMGQKFQIWNPLNWQNRKKESDQSLIHLGLPSLKPEPAR